MLFDPNIDPRTGKKYHYDYSLKYKKPVLNLGSVKLEDSFPQETVELLKDYCFISPSEAGVKYHGDKDSSTVKMEEDGLILLLENPDLCKEHGILLIDWRPPKYRDSSFRLTPDHVIENPINDVEKIPYLIRNSRDLIGNCDIIVNLCRFGTVSDHVTYNYLLKRTRKQLSLDYLMGAIDGQGLNCPDPSQNNNQTEPDDFLKENSHLFEYTK